MCGISGAFAFTNKEVCFWKRLKGPINHLPKEGQMGALFLRMALGYWGTADFL
jgi:hypothetical protein